MLVCNFVSKQGKIRAEHELKKEKWITISFRHTLISHKLYEVGKT